ncbi:MAG: hypothetical protein R3B49_07240 [Phycisphaerales bacterium]
MFNRIGDAFVGVVLIIAGLALLAGLHLLGRMPPHDPWHAVGVALGATLYSILAELFIALGLEKIAGPQSRLTRFMHRSRTRLVITLVLTAIAIVVCVLIVVW